MHYSGTEDKEAGHSPETNTWQLRAVCLCCSLRGTQITHSERKQQETQDRKPQGTTFWAAYALMNTTSNKGGRVGERSHIAATSDVPSCGKTKTLFCAEILLDWISNTSRKTTTTSLHHGSVEKRLDMRQTQRIMKWI